MSRRLTKRPAAAEFLLDECVDLELDVAYESGGDAGLLLRGPSNERITVDLRSSWSMIEQVLRQLEFDFADLPPVVVGESKDIRALTRRVIVAKLLPTVYSFTNNRYGHVPGTDLVRAQFSSAVFRAMADNPGSRHMSSAFLGLVESKDGPLLVERRMDTCNLETRVKRYHIGSPLFRYRYADQHPTVHGPPLKRWTRFDRPVVCFDWRHPLVSEDGTRLADEPISDDYASLWMENVPYAKRLAVAAFEWLEERFSRHGLVLVDICFFIDRSGRVIYGEISPDCMRVRSAARDGGEAFDKDQWRSGGEPEEVLRRYQRLYEIVFGWEEHNGTDAREESASEDLSGWGDYSAGRRTEGIGDGAG